MYGGYVSVLRRGTEVGRGRGCIVGMKAFGVGMFERRCSFFSLRVRPRGAKRDSGSGCKTATAAPSGPPPTLTQKMLVPFSTSGASTDEIVSRSSALALAVARALVVSFPPLPPAAPVLARAFRPWLPSGLDFAGFSRALCG